MGWRRGRLGASSRRGRDRRAIDLGAFRAEPGPALAHHASRRQLLALLGIVVVVAASIAVASYLVHPNRARSFHLFYGSLFINDNTAPVAVDLSNGRPTVRLVDAASEVSAKASTDVQVVPLQSGTLLLNQSTGEFNMVAATGLAVKAKGGGVKLARNAHTSALAAGTDAYLVQGNSVVLVNQSTVQSAAVSARNTRPRAALTLPASVAYNGARVAAASTSTGDLWLLSGPSGTRTIDHLSVPDGTAAGASLRSSTHGTVGAVSAIAVTASTSDVLAGSSEPVVGVAGDGSVRLFRGDRHLRTVKASGLSGADLILAGTGGQDELTFLAHRSTGWSEVIVPTTSGSAGSHRIEGIPAGAQLAAPAASQGHLYTADITTGRLYQLEPDGRTGAIQGLSSYPVNKIERSGFGDIYLIARGARVLIDSAGHSTAVAVFTDGSQPPLLINKSVAADLTATGSALAVGKNAPSKKTTGPKKAPTQKAPAQQQISQQSLCKTVQQTPHQPVILQPSTGSRSATLNWTYPLLSPKDCLPSTYTVKITTLSATAPSAPGIVTVQGQTGVTVTGLFPSTRYQVVVTAYLGGLGTASGPMQITTGPEGPAAPTGVSVTADQKGNWTVSWHSCGGQSTCVPATQWTIIPSYCDAQSLSSSPSPITIAADPTQGSFQQLFPGTVDRGMSFQVQGAGAQGTLGAIAGNGSCVYSWAPANASAFRITASTPRNVPVGQTASADVTVTVTGNPITAAGGQGATLLVQLLQGGQVVKSQSQPVTSSATYTATLGGVIPGTSYTAQAIVTPPAQSGNPAVTVGPTPLSSVASSWPAWTVNPTWSASPLIGGAVNITLGGISSAAAGGDRFDINASLTCGSTSVGSSTPVLDADPASAQPSIPVINNATIYGSCTVSVTLDDLGDYYGGGSNTATGTVTIPQLTLTGNSSSDFTATWAGLTSDGSHANIKVTYDGANALLIERSTNWRMSVSNSCGQDNGDAPPAQIGNVPATAACLTSSTRVTIGYSWFGIPQNPITIRVGGTVPTPAPTPSPTPTTTPK